MNRRPRKADDSDWEPFPERILALVRELDWVEDASVRLREDGHLFFGDVLVVPRPGTPDLVRRLGEAHRQVLELDWRVHDVVIAPVERLPRGGE